MLRNLTSFVVILSLALSSCAQVTQPQSSGERSGTSTTGSQGSNTNSDRGGTNPSSNSSSSSSNQSGLSGLSNEQVVAGLKEALSLGAQNSSTKLSAADAYFKNAFIKILMPPEAKEVESQLRALGMGKLVDDAILSMNRAAETAAKDAAPIFLDAIKKMSFNDAVGIVTGSKDAATQYLKKTTSPQLTTKFKPVIQSALDKTDATKYWNDVFSNYNKIPFVNKVNPDLTSYVTQEALDGLFYTLALEEAKIREDPVGTANSLIKLVFGN